MLCFDIESRLFALRVHRRDAFRGLRWLQTPCIKVGHMENHPSRASQSIALLQIEDPQIARPSGAAKKMRFALHRGEAPCLKHLSKTARSASRSYRKVITKIFSILIMPPKEFFRTYVSADPDSLETRVAKRTPYA